MANDRLSYLQQEVIDGPNRIPPMPEVQVSAHQREIRALVGEFSIAPVIDLDFIRSLKAMPDNPFYEPGAA